jgi:hypothetical protein
MNQLSPANFPTIALALGSAYKLSDWTIAVKTIFWSFLSEEAIHKLWRFLQCHTVESFKCVGAKFCGLLNFLQVYGDVILLIYIFVRKITVECFLHWWCKFMGDEFHENWATTNSNLSLSLSLSLSIDRSNLSLIWRRYQQSITYKFLTLIVADNYGNKHCIL